jgi:integrase
MESNTNKPANSNTAVRVTEELAAAWAAHLTREERAPATVEKYLRDARAFAAWLGGVPATQESAAAYKRSLAETRAPAGVNAAVAALNGFFAFLGLPVRLKPLKVQRKTWLDAEKELTKAEYERLLAAARRDGNERLNLLMQTVCATGIRVSELRFITAEAARAGLAVVANKGKTRTILIPQKLKSALLAYAKKRGIRSGCIFVTKSGKPLDRRNVWADMKALCEKAGVAPGKVFPHNLRRLFARAFYSVDKDIMRLADLLGHSDVKTTRIYLMESGTEHRRRIDRLGLVFGL